MKVLLGILQIMTFLILAAITVHAFMLQAYVAKQRKGCETSVPATDDRTPCSSAAESWSEFNHVPIPDPLIHGISKAASRPGRAHATRTSSA